MNLQPVNPPRDNSVQCIVCGKMGQTKDMLADLDGVPFKSFVHRNGAPDGPGTQFYCETLYRRTAHYAVKRDEEIKARVATFNDAWTAIHKASHGASVQWQMRYEGWRIIRVDSDGSETELNEMGEAVK